MASIIEELSIDEWEEPERYVPSYNVAPTHTSPILIFEGNRRIRPMRWGLVPSWAKDDSFAARTINARFETLREKPAYRHLLHGKRCIVIADGYYEWSGSSGGKIPNYIYAADGSLLLMAGLWDTWNQSESESLTSYTIITTGATGDMASIHPRMPVIFTGETASTWIDAEKHPFETFTSLFQSSAASLTSHPVSRKVNSVGYNHPDCIEPCVYPSQEQLF